MSVSVSGPVTGDLDGLLATATAWRDQDPDDETRDELDRLVTRATSSDDEALAELADRFAGRLQDRKSVV